MRHAYYAAVSWLDHNLGTVIDSLESEGLKDNTVVLLHGDHGQVVPSPLDIREFLYRGLSID